MELIDIYHAATDKYLRNTLLEVSSRSDTITCNKFIPAFAVMAHHCGSTLRYYHLEVEELEVLLFESLTLLPVLIQTFMKSYLAVTLATCIHSNGSTTLHIKVLPMTRGAQPVVP